MRRREESWLSESMQAFEGESESCLWWVEEPANSRSGVASPRLDCLLGKAKGRVAMELAVNGLHPNRSFIRDCSPHSQCPRVRVERVGGDA